VETSLIAAKDASGQGSSALASKEKKFSDAVRERRATPAFSSGPVDARHIHYPGDATIVGRVTGVAMRIVEAREGPTRTSPLS
jgi:hypothetical protein